MYDLRQREVAGARPVRVARLAPPMRSLDVRGRMRSLGVKPVLIADSSSAQLSSAQLSSGTVEDRACARGTQSCMDGRKAPFWTNGRSQWRRPQYDERLGATAYACVGKFRGGEESL